MTVCQEPVGTDEAAYDLPVRLPSLGEPKPNPFNTSIQMTYSLSHDSYVTLEVRDATGRAIKRIVDGPRHAGSHLVLWDGKDEGGLRARSGVYIVRLECDRFQVSRRVILR